MSASARGDELDRHVPASADARRRGRQRHQPAGDRRDRLLLATERWSALAATVTARASVSSRTLQPEDGRKLVERNHLDVAGHHGRDAGVPAAATAAAAPTAPVDRHRHDDKATIASQHRSACQDVDGIITGGETAEHRPTDLRLRIQTTTKAATSRLVRTITFRPDRSTWRPRAPGSPRMRSSRRSRRHPPAPWRDARCGGTVRSPRDRET